LKYSETQALDSDAIVEFTKGLCRVAAEELNSTVALRVYSITKIVEVSMYNTARIRLVWTRIWGVLNDFFSRVGCHPNQTVAMFAIDSLRQMASRSLERDELSNFSFQVRAMIILFISFLLLNLNLIV
jgi:brefeldin A-inhibited guanine nucleotide-exchange protein